MGRLNDDEHVDVVAVAVAADIDEDTDVDADAIELLSRNAEVVATVEFEWRLTVDVLCTDGIGGFGDVGGVIDTTISSLSISSSFSLLTDALSVGEHCDFKTASNIYRFVSSSADLLPVRANKFDLPFKKKKIQINVQSMHLSIRFFLCFVSN